MDSAKKAVDIKSSKLSSTVMDYYFKYGQNRDLEKYLRLRKHSTSKSSSDGSLQFVDSSNEQAAHHERIVKSMETLHMDGDQLELSDAIDKSASEPESKADRRPEKARKKTSENDAPANSQKKTLSRHERKQIKQKSYNLNLESNIEINLPTLAASMPPIPIVIQPADAHENRTTKTSESVETQTVRTPAKLVQSKATETDQLELSQDKFTTALAVPARDDSPRPSGNKSALNADTSPASSVASAKYRLEWDSMADIGYNRIIDFKSQSNQNLTTFERSALTKFFAEHGVRFDDSLMLMANSDPKGSPLQKRSFTQSATEMHDAKKLLSSSAKKATPTSSKHSWQQALEKYRDKYGKRRPNEMLDMTGSGIDSTQFMSLSMAPHHSTPVAEAPVPKDDVKQVSAVVPAGIRAERTATIEKSCQTVASGTETVGVQVENAIDVASAAIQTDHCHSAETSKGNEADLTSATSFEFIAPCAYANPMGGNARFSAESVRAHGADSEAESMGSPAASGRPNVEEKENVPPDEEKENIPPPKAQLSRQKMQNNAIDMKQSEASASESNTSLLPLDLQKGVDLINVLMESRNMNRDTKKKCIRKMVSRLLRSETDGLHDISHMLMSLSGNATTSKPVSDHSLESSDTSAIGTQSRPQMSGVSALSSSANSTASSILREAANKPNAPLDETTSEKDWLKPVTQSEMVKELSRRSQNESGLQAERQQRPRAASNNDIIAFLKHEKATHFNWIDQEIQHLHNLKTLLANMQISGPNNDDALRAVYENFRHIRNETSGNASQADISSALQDSSVCSNEQPKTQPRRRLSHQANWAHKPADRAEDSCNSDADRRSAASNPKASQNVYDVADDAPEWNSHFNTHKMAKNRTKLDTPRSDESVECFARNRRAKFDRARAKAQPDPIEKPVTAERSRPIYTKPYSTDSYSEAESRKRSADDRGKQLRNVDVSAYTSGSGIDDFLSSNSMSIAVAANSTSNTTTHQYDSKISVGSQTTDTLQRMRPVHLKQPIEPIVEEPDAPSTVRVNKLMLNKQIQVRPNAVAYVIMFDEQPVDRSGSSSRRATAERGNQLYAETARASDTRGHSGDGDSDASAGAVRAGDGRRSAEIERSSETSSALSVENLTLQEHLRLKRPDFYASAEQRRQYVQGLHQLRHERNEQRTNLFAANTCGNANTLNRNMQRLLPPQPLAQMRLFSSREIVQQTRQKYQELPEIRQRQQLERDRQIRRNHRIMMDIFNKKLQENALKGKINLSNSMSVLN